MSLERVDSVDPAEVYDYIICGWVSPISYSLNMADVASCAGTLL